MKFEFIILYWWKNVLNLNTHCKMISGMHGQENPQLCARFTGGDRSLNTGIT
jgi:hypothetical protein